MSKSVIQGKQESNQPDNSVVEIDENALKSWEEIANEEIIESKNWVYLKYKNDRKLVFVADGKEGLVKGKEMLDDQEIGFLLVRGCHSYALNIIFIDLVFQWLPPKASAFDRAKSTFHIEHIVSKFSLNHFFLIEVNELSQMESENIVRKVRKIASHRDGKYSFDGRTVTFRRKRQMSIIKIRKREEQEKMEKIHDKQREINVFQEIYDTEVAYVDQMTDFYEEIVLPMKEVNLAFHLKLFTMVKLILDINRPFLESIKECSFTEEERESFLIDPEQQQLQQQEQQQNAHAQKIKNVAKLVELLVAQCPVFKLYLPYINMYTHFISKTKQLLAEDPNFEKFCHDTKLKLEEKGSRNTDIFGFLIMPIQRIPRYSLLMRELHRKTKSDDPNFPKIEEGLDKVGEIARYIDSKKEENEMSSKMIELSRKYKLKDLVKMHRKMKKIFPGKLIESKKSIKNCEIFIFNDLIIVGGYHPKKCVRIDLQSVDVRCIPDSDKENVFVLETDRKRYSIDMMRRDKRDNIVTYIQTILAVNSSQSAMSNQISGRTIFQSYLHKEGGGKFSYNIKKRWHVVTTDYKMKYYESPGGKYKGSYTIHNCIVGKGRDVTKRKKGFARIIQHTASMDLKAVSMSEKKECWFYIASNKRTYFLLAENVMVLDNWIKVLELVGCRRKDLLDFEEREWQRRELERLKNRKGIGSMKSVDPSMLNGLGGQDDDDFELPDMFGVNHDDNVKKMNMMNEKEEEIEGEGEEDQKEEEKDDDDDENMNKVEVKTEENETKEEEQQQKEVKEVDDEHMNDEQKNDEVNNNNNNKTTEKDPKNEEEEESDEEVNIHLLQRAIKNVERKDEYESTETESSSSSQVKNSEGLGGGF